MKYSDIDWVFLTHTHLDHCFYASLFQNVKIVGCKTIHDRDVEFSQKGKIPKMGLKIIATPGHSNEHCSLVVPTEKGVYVVAG